MGTEDKYISRIITTEVQIKNRIKIISKEIESFFDKEEIVFVVLLKGGMMYANDLMRIISTDLTIEFVTASSYLFKEKVNKPIVDFINKSIDLKGKNVLIVDDLIDSGETAVTLISKINKLDPKRIAISAVYGKPIRKKLNIKEFYCWEKDPGGFLLGYGLDFDERYRNLPYIAIINNKEK